MFSSWNRISSSLGVFLVQHKEIRQKKSGEPYLSLTLADRTGDLDAKMWDNAPEVMDTFDRDCFLQGEGHGADFSKPAAADHLPIAAGWPKPRSTSPISCRRRNAIAMKCSPSCKGWIAAITNPHLKALLETDLRRRSRRAGLSHRPRGEIHSSRLDRRA